VPYWAATNATEADIVAPLQIVIRYVTLGWLFALLVIVVLQLLNGRINVRGLLAEKTAAGVRAVSGARVQLLLATVTAAGMYITDTLTTTTTGRLPEMQTPWLAALAASNGIHLLDKLVRALMGRQAGPGTRT
jgi:hypothetical protein